MASADRVYNGRPVIQTDLNLSEGSSGGPVFDKHGRLVGVIVARIDQLGQATLVSPINQAYGLLRKCGVTVPDPGSTAAPFAEVKAAVNATDAERQAIDVYNRGVAAALPQEKAAEYEQAVRLWPALFEAWFNLGVAYTSLGRNGDAMDVYRKARALHPESTAVLRNLGRLLLKEGKLPEVAECFERAVALAPNDPGARNDLGEAYRRLNRLEEARASFLKALELRSDYAAARYNLGLTCAALERWPEALASFRSVPPPRTGRAGRRQGEDLGGGAGKERQLRNPTRCPSRIRQRNWDATRSCANSAAAPWASCTRAATRSWAGAWPSRRLDAT